MEIVLEEILDEIHELTEAVKTHSVIHEHSLASTVSISTVIYAPRLCSLDVYLSMPDRLPPVGFWNRKRDIKCLNIAIATLNKGRQFNYIKLHMEGISLDKTTGKIMHKHNPVRQIWR